MQFVFLAKKSLFLRKETASIIGFKLIKFSEFYDPMKLVDQHDLCASRMNLSKVSLVA